MFFPLFSKVFIDILRIYELPKIYNKTPEYCQILALTIIIYRASSMSQLNFFLNYTRINFIESVPLDAKDSFDTKFLKKS